jgi:hypothetical protein
MDLLFLKLEESIIYKPLKPSKQTIDYHKIIFFKYKPV